MTIIRIRTPFWRSLVTVTTTTDCSCGINTVNVTALLSGKRNASAITWNRTLLLTTITNTQDQPPGVCVGGRREKVAVVSNGQRINSCCTAACQCENYNLPHLINNPLVRYLNYVSRQPVRGRPVAKSTLVYARWLVALRSRDLGQ